jgi:hypothetical protein
MEKVRSAARAATKRRGAMRGWVGMKKECWCGATAWSGETRVWG